MNMKKYFYIIIGILVSLIYSCDYPEFEVTYSAAYPICGDYYVTDYDFETGEPIENQIGYPLYIYNKAYNPNGDSIWVDNYTGHPSGGTIEYGYKFKIKCKADLQNLTFNCAKTGNVTGANVNPLDSAVSVMIENSKIIDLSADINDPAADSIYFEFTFFDKYGNAVKKIITAGHRRTGWENPEFSDPME